MAAPAPPAGWPPLPPLGSPLPELVQSHRGPTKRSNWIIPGRLLAGDRASLDSEAGVRAILLQAGVTTIVCLQTRQETKAAVDYRKRAREIAPATAFHEQPIPDQEVVDDAIVELLVSELVQRLEANEVLYVHCRGGHGRTGTVCALLLGRLYRLGAVEAMTRIQLYHDTRVQPVFAAEGYEETEDGAGCVVLFPVQREQVLRLLPAAAASAAPLGRASSTTYGPGASHYDEATMRSWLAAGEAASAALRRAKGPERQAALLEAAAGFREARRLRPDFVRGHVGLARALRLAGRREEAHEVLQEALPLWPEDAALAEEARLLGPLEAEVEEAAAAQAAAPAAPPPPTWRPRVSDPRFVMLVGLPGCGKSTFANQLVASGKGWYRICQDEVGGRAAVEAALGPAARDPQRRVVFDRCNELREDRKYFLSLAFNPASAVCVHFDMPAADCEARAAARTDHPTIKFGGGRNAVRSKAASFEVPKVDEGFQEVIVVRDFRDADHLLTCWGAAAPSIAPMGFFKFPTTPHVLDLGATLTESDRLLTPSEAAQFFDGKTVVHVEEKVDGANCGIFLTADYELRFQNRAKYVTSAYASQWKGLTAWQEQHTATICTILEPEVEILFGEWCLARHSVPYTSLPGYFVAFDIYNKREGRFCSVRERNRRLEGTGIPIVPALAERAFMGVADLTSLLQQPSRYYDGPMEGLYLRIDEPEERGGGLWLERRGKVVQPGFLQTLEDDGHWTHKEMVKNGIEYG